MDTKSETTKRIEEILDTNLNCAEKTRLSRLAIKELAEILHQEVIRGKEEHTKLIMEKISKLPIYGQFNKECCEEILADLERQIKEKE